MPDRIQSSRRSLSRLVKTAPLAFIAFVVSYITATQVVTPHHRMIKLLVMGGVVLFMFRFDLVISLFMFTMLFPFPSGVALGSTNYILITLITLIWGIRATSTGVRIFDRTGIEAACALFMVSYLLSFWNVDTEQQLTEGAKVVWRQLSCFAYFYLMVRFIRSEKLLVRLTQVMAIACALVMVTGLLELFFPGKQIIPGWIGLLDTPGTGSLTYRLEGVRLHGAVKGHNILSDMAMINLVITLTIVTYTRNPAIRAFWALSALMTFIVIVGAANRGAFTALTLAIVYWLFLLRKRLSFAGVLGGLGAFIVGFLLLQWVLSEYTYAISLLDRILGTQFEGMVPDTRTMTWKPTLDSAMKHPIVGQGPWFDAGAGLERVFWPHNAYLFYFHTLGIVGLSAFLWICWGVVKRSTVFRHPAIRGTRLGYWLLMQHVLVTVFLIGQFRTDHQRDDVYPFIVWFLFGVVVSGYRIAMDRIRAAEGRDGAS